MPSSYTQNGGIIKPANGELPNTWGDAANTDFDIIDRLTNGVGSIALSGTTYTILTGNGTLSEGQYKVITFTGSLASACTVTVSPNTAQKFFFVRNSTNQSVILTQGSGATVTIPATQSRIVYCDGGGTTAAVFDFSSVSGLVSPVITTPTITGGTINNTIIGGTTPVAGTFTTATATTQMVAPAFANTGNLSINANGANYISLITNSAERMRVDSAGNVGIGATTVLYKLHLNIGSATDIETATVNTAGTSRFGTRSSGNAFAGSFTAAKALEFWSANSQNAILDASGNFGVGITPTQRLHVSGNAIVTGSWTFGTQAIGPADSASAPAFTWTGDLTTGLYRAGAGIVGITTAGVERVRWDSTLMTLAAGVGAVSTAANDGAPALNATYTPSPAGGNFKYLTNNNAFKIAPPSAAGDYSMVIQVTNGSTAGAVTFTAAWGDARGDTPTTVNAAKFLVFITKCNGFTTAVVQSQ